MTFKKLTRAEREALIKAELAEFEKRNDIKVSKEAYELFLRSGIKLVPSK
jgi:hypothetical protein